MDNIYIYFDRVLVDKCNYNLNFLFIIYLIKDGFIRMNGLMYILLFKDGYIMDKLNIR